MKSSATLLCLIGTRFDLQKETGDSDQFNTLKGTLAFFLNYTFGLLSLQDSSLSIYCLRAINLPFFSTLISKGKVDAQHFLKECTSGILGDAAVHVSELILL